MLAAFVIAVTTSAPSAQADVEWDKKMAFLIAVTARPGYNFANADDALTYGQGICDKVGFGRGYPQLITDVQADFNTTDDYQASYLIDRAVNELCPEQIWQLRRAAAHYRPPAPSTP